MSTVKFFAVIALIVLCVGSESQQDNDLDANKKLVRRFVEISNAAEWDRLAEIVALDFQRHSTATAGPPVRSLDDFISLQKSFLTVFPDQKVRLDNMIAEGNFVAIRAAYLGTQTGPMGNLPATGKSVDGPFIAFFRIDSGKIAELWVEWDNVAMLTQLGLSPPLLPEDADAKRKKLAVEFLRGIYTGDPSVVDRIAAPDIVVSYPIFAEIFKAPAIRGREAVRDFAIGFSERWVDASVTVHHVVADGDEVVLVWEFQARSANSGKSGDAEATKNAWGGVTLYRFDEADQIALELGEESTPGPVARLPGAFNDK
jgi:steroid delta-isomerase-like uncharacterized protein